jgi:hypothetical protein
MAFIQKVLEVCLISSMNSGSSLMSRLTWELTLIMNQVWLKYAKRTEYSMISPPARKITNPTLIIPEVDFSRGNNALASAYLSLIFFQSCFSTSTPPTLPPPTKMMAIM